MGLMARLRWLVAGLAGLVSLGLLPGAASAAGCANEVLRTGLSANLPDCRAYEMVSPVDKNDGAVLGGPGLWESSLDGSKVAYESSQAFADSQTSAATQEGDFYIATRGASGWSSHALLPPQAANQGTPVPVISAFSPDLSSAILQIGGISGQDSPPLVAGEPQDTSNLFVRDNANDSYKLVDVTPPGVTLGGIGVLFGSRTSSDLSHVVFAAAAKLTADAPVEGVSLYEWSDGGLSLVSILPGGAPVESGDPSYVSEDGSRVIFEGHGLFLRDGGARTVQVDASQGPGPGAEGHSEFMVASGDASRIFFRALGSAGLTNDTVPGSGPNLYEYDVAGGRLMDLTPDAVAEVRGVSAISKDGSYVYFVAEGALAAGANAGEPNLYVLHEGTTTFIATLKPGSGGEGDESDFRKEFVRRVRITPDGTRFAFDSKASLTGYDNTDANTGEADNEVFLYDATTGQLVCVSCNPSGARPVGPSRIAGVTNDADVSSEPETEALSESVGDAPNGGGGQFRSRYLSEDGSRLFFNSFDALVPRDTNGRRDVYEYEDGSVRLISSGSSGVESVFLEASPDGSNVFFTTAQQLAGQDEDQQFDLYDARVGGGFPAPVAGSSCGGEACLPVAVGAPALGVPGSATFVGAGNLGAPAAVPVGTVKPKPKPRPKKKVKRRRAKRSAARGARHAGGRGLSTGKRG
jgi:Tol biopolymer transport system component